MGDQLIDNEIYREIKNSGFNKSNVDAFQNARIGRNGILNGTNQYLAQRTGLSESVAGKIKQALQKRIK